MRVPGALFLASLAFFLPEMFVTVWLQSEEGLLSGPHPVTAAFILLAIGVVLPACTLVYLWLAERNPLRFALLATAAAFLIWGVAGLVGSILVVCHGIPFTLSELAFNLMPMLIVVVSLGLWMRLTYGQQTRNLRT